LASLKGGGDSFAIESIRLLKEMVSNATALKLSSSISESSSANRELAESLQAKSTRLEFLINQLEGALHDTPKQYVPLEKGQMDPLFNRSIQPMIEFDAEAKPTWVEDVHLNMAHGNPKQVQAAKDVYYAAVQIKPLVESIQAQQLKLEALPEHSPESLTLKNEIQDQRILLDRNLSLVERWKQYSIDRKSLHREMRELAFPFLSEMIRQQGQKKGYLTAPTGDLPIDDVSFKKPELYEDFYSGMGKYQDNEVQIFVSTPEAQNQLTVRLLGQYSSSKIRLMHAPEGDFLIVKTTQGLEFSVHILVSNPDFHETSNSSHPPSDSVPEPLRSTNREGLKPKPGDGIADTKIEIPTWRPPRISFQEAFNYTQHADPKLLSEIDHLKNSEVQELGDLARQTDQKLNQTNNPEEVKSVLSDYENARNVITSRWVQAHEPALQNVLTFLKELPTHDALWADLEHEGVSKPNISSEVIPHGRLKDPSDVAAKIERRKMTSSEAFTDFAGARIVVDRYDDAFPVIAALQKKYKVRASYGSDGTIQTRLSHVEVVDGKEVVVLDAVPDQDRIHRIVEGNRSRGYRAIHLVLDLNGHPVEVQIQTKLLYEWGKIQHELSYKNDSLPQLVKDEFQIYCRDVADYLAHYEQGHPLQDPPSSYELREMAKGLLPDEQKVLLHGIDQMEKLVTKIPVKANQKKIPSFAPGP
ncbi:MAG: hypothetical protein JNK65_01005, partial [Deltaproteobacteria bacterium]|nr:hypothetical protein [Deltaproteobacteria bacterium]